MIRYTFVPLLFLPLFLFLALCKNHFSHRFNTLSQRSFGRTDVTAAAALAAFHTIHLFESCHIAVFCKSCKTGRNHMSRTDAYATSAIDTCSLDLLRLGDCVTLQEKQGRSCLRTWNMKIIQSKSHHRSAGD